MSAFALFLRLQRFAAAVVPAAEQPVEWRGRVSVIEIEILVVQLVEPVASADLESTPELDEIESRMRRRRTDTLEQAGQDNDDRVYRHEPPQHEHAEINRMFQRMHRDPGPGDGVDVAMM